MDFSSTANPLAGMRYSEVSDDVRDESMAQWTLWLNWEGPYLITSSASIEAYFLEDLDEHVIPR